MVLRMHMSAKSEVHLRYDVIPDGGDKSLWSDVSDTETWIDEST